MPLLLGGKKKTAAPQPRVRASSGSGMRNEKSRPNEGDKPTPPIPPKPSFTEAAANIAAIPAPAWITIFHSDDPSVWNSGVADVSPLGSLPADIKYSKLQIASGEYMIIEVTRELLGKGGGDGRYRWYGEGDLRLMPDSLASTTRSGPQPTRGRSAS